jgi:hypothetical protein
MARRPVFVPLASGADLVEEVSVDFTWYAGFAVSQKQRSIRSLHVMARRRHGLGELLEVSSKSESELGRRLSSFSLPVSLPDGRRVPVECAFQGSKVFVGGGPYVDLYEAAPGTAKRDPRVRGGGDLVAFSFFGESWPLDPTTGFYDWLYVQAAADNVDGASVSSFGGFTDIEFNTARSLNCQARSLARFVALDARGLLEQALADKESFLGLYPGQARLA